MAKNGNRLKYSLYLWINVVVFPNRSLSTVREVDKFFYHSEWTNLRCISFLYYSVACCSVLDILEGVRLT